MNIIGIGTDLVSIFRIKRLWDRFGFKFAKRILTAQEFENLQMVQAKASFLAKRYAAKEAVAKAVGTGFQPGGLLLNEIGVRHDTLGRPYLYYCGRTKTAIGALGVQESQISLSDERAYAVAFVVLMGADKKMPQ